MAVDGVDTAVFLDAVSLAVPFSGLNLVVSLEIESLVGPVNCERTWLVVS